MKDTIYRKDAIDLFPNDALEWDTKDGYIAPHLARRMIEELPLAQPKSRHDDIADFVVYQINWLKSHHDLEMEPVLEDAVVQMLKDTGKCYIDETEPEEFERCCDSAWRE